MKFREIKKVFDGAFLIRYDAVYETETGMKKVYEMVSRDKNLTTQEELYSHGTNAVVMFLTDERGERLLLLREFRMPTGEFVYNMPAGLLFPGETLMEAARRELREETGLELVSVGTILPAAYSAVGFTNEKNTMLIGTARGDIQPSDSDEEEILCGWYTKDEVRRMVLTEPFETRTQLYGWLWAASSESRA